MARNIDSHATSLAIAAMLKAQENRAAELDSARTATPDAPKAPKSEGKSRAKAPKAPKAIKGSQGNDASGFSVYRGIRSTGPGWVAGSAGIGSEVSKMRDSLARHAAIAEREAREATVAAEAAELVAAEEAEAGNADYSSLASEESVLQRGLAAIKADLARQIRAELESADNATLAKRYASLGEDMTEEVIAVEFGSMPGAKLDGSSVVETAGIAYSVPSTVENLLALHPELRKAVKRAEQK